MSYRYSSAVAALLALTVALTGVTAPAAIAGGKKYKKHPVHAYHPGKAKGHWKNRGVHYVDYVAVRRPRYVVYQPVSTDYFYWQRPRFVVVRPVPVWVAPYGGSGLNARIGVYGGNVSFDLAFSNHSAPAYGCGFCGAHYTQYAAWESHVHGCNRGPDGPIVCERWASDDLAYYRAQARDQWNREYCDNGYNGHGGYGGGYYDGYGDDD